MLNIRLNNKGFGLAEAIVSMVVIALVSWVTLDAINRVRVYQAKTESYEEARTIAKNAYEFFVFASNANDSDDDYNYIKLISERIELVTKEVYDYANSDDHENEFAYVKADDGSYSFNYEASYYHLLIKVNYEVDRPTFYCQCTSSNDKEIFTLSYEKATYDNISTDTIN